MVSDYLSRRIQMYLKLWFFILIKHFHNQGLGISLFIFYSFSSKEVETPRCFFSELAGYESGFLVNLLITTGKQSPFTIFFFSSTSTIPYPCSFSSPFIPASILLSGKWGETWKVLRFGKFFDFSGLQVCYSMFQ